MENRADHPERGAARGDRPGYSPSRTFHLFFLILDFTFQKDMNIPIFNFSTGYEPGARYPIANLNNKST